MPATSANSRSNSATRNRLPLTPKVVASRRGGHAATRPARSAAAPAPAPVAVTPAMHLTPTVVSAARGGLTLSDIRLSDAFKAGALDMRGLRF